MKNINTNLIHLYILLITISNVRETIMNGYERINAVLDKKTPDRLPVMLHNFIPAARVIGLSSSSIDAKHG